MTLAITPDQLRAIAPVGDLAGVFAAPLNAAMDRFGIAARAGVAAFLAEALHESGNLVRMSESLNYSPAGLLGTFEKYFTPATAALYGRTAAHPADQRAIACIAYANRMGNGPATSGDGWRYRGRGPGQLTGKDNYRKCGAVLGIDLVADPDLVSGPAVGCMAFGWFWDAGNRTGKSLNLLADTGRIDDVSRAINGGDNGLLERRALYNRAITVLGGV